MRFEKCDFCEHDVGPLLRRPEACVNCSFCSNFKLKSKLTAAETLMWIKLSKQDFLVVDTHNYEKEKKTNTKEDSMGLLIGDLKTGYKYLTDDEEIQRYYATEKATAEMLAREAASRKAQKERNNMKTKDIYALAQVPGGIATLTAENVEIPVKIKEIKPEHGIYQQSITEIVCERVEPWSKNNPYLKKESGRHYDPIKKVYFNNPVTVVIWTDGTKTIVKAQGDEPYDPEKGLAMAIAKKFLGDNENKSNYYDVFKKWLPKKPEPTVWRWKIWMTHYDPDGNIVGYGLHPQDYATKSSAVRRAKQLWGDNNPACKWEVSQTNPWEKEEK